MSCVTLLKAALARFLFGLHSLVTVWRVVSQEEDSYWKIAFGIVVQFLEGLHSLCYRKGEELKWFCPSVLIYLGTLVPAIWILELKSNRRETLCLYLELIQEKMNSARLEDQIRTSMLLDIMQIKREDLSETAAACRPILTDQNRKLALSNEEGLKKILDINVNIALKPEQWTRILEQVALVVLILGRWLLPKGSLSRDQFSQLMLVYIGMAADIVEIFEAFRESKVILEPSLTYAILGVWTLSLFQFCLILSGGHRARKHRMTYASEEDYGDDANKHKVPKDGESALRRPSLLSARSSSSDCSEEEKKRRVKMDMITIIASLILQDGPFICLRMTLIFKFKVISHMNIFFTCKNTLVILLQMYRLLILCLELRPQYRRASRSFSLVPYLSEAYHEESHSQEEEPSSERLNSTSEEASEEDIALRRKKRRRKSHPLINPEERTKKLKFSSRVLLKGINSTSEEYVMSSTSEREDEPTQSRAKANPPHPLPSEDQSRSLDVISALRRKSILI